MFEDMPEKYRPITVLSVIVRGFCKILAEGLALTSARRDYVHVDRSHCRLYLTPFELDMILRQRLSILSRVFIAIVIRFCGAVLNLRENLP